MTHPLEDIDLNTLEDVKEFFWACCQCGDIASLKALHEDEFHVMVLTLEAVEGFFIACEHGHLEMVQTLFDKIDSPLCWHHFSDEILLTNMLHIVARGWTDMVRYFIEHPKYTLKNSMNSLLIYAGEHDHWDVVKLFIESPYTNCNNIKDHHLVFEASLDASGKVAKAMLLDPAIGLLPFQKSVHNVTWAMKNHKTDLLFAMIHHLKRYDPIEYLHHINEVKKYAEQMNAREQFNALNDMVDDVSIHAEIEIIL